MLTVFNSKNIERVYLSMKNGKMNAGLDRISKKVFEKNINLHISDISKKINNNTYKFTSYKEVLINKGKEKPPRVISIPTIRDKIVLKILHEIIGKKFKKHIINPLAKHDLIASIGQSIKKNKYNYYLSMDIENYYDHVNHDKLYKTIISKINDKPVIDLLFSAIKNYTFPENLSNKERLYIKRNKGLPQGIPISNPLANIYLQDFDRLMRSKRKFKYFRYVDDLLILCKQKDSEEIKKFIREELEKYELSLHKENEKIKEGVLPQKINFLGYTFLENGDISISQKNVRRMEYRLEQNFKEFINAKDKNVKNNLNLLIWNLDLLISGVAINNRTYGWIYYFKQNECEEIMHHLDKVLIKMINRFKLQNDLLYRGKYKGKKFVRIYHELKGKNNFNKFIINMDKVDINYKRNILQNVYKRDTKKMSDSFVDFEFNRYIFKSIRDIEYDLQQIYS